MSKGRGGTWSRARKKWFMFNHPDEHGNYTCGLCLLPVHMSVVTLDHIKPWDMYPGLRYMPSNFQPAHGTCNNQRGIFIRKVATRNAAYHATLRAQEPAILARFNRYLIGTPYQNILQNH